MNGAEISVFAFSSADDAQTAADNVSADGYGITGEGFITWTGSPHFYITDSLIVLYVGEDHDL